MNWSKALKYILRLNEISNRILGHSLQDYRQDIKELWNYFDIHFANEELNISASIPNINLEHRLDDMTDEDIVFFGNCTNFIHFGRHSIQMNYHNGFRLNPFVQLIQNGLF